MKLVLSVAALPRWLAIGNRWGSAATMAGEVNGSGAEYGNGNRNGNGGSGRIDRRVANLIALVVMTIWAISYLVDMAKPTYDPPVGVHVIMMLVAGAAYGTGQLGKGLKK